MTDSPRVVVDAELLPQLQRCVSGAETCSWIGIASLSANAELFRQWNDRAPLAIILDGRAAGVFNRAALDDLSIDPATRLSPRRLRKIVVVVDNLIGNSSTELSQRGFSVVTSDELGSGRLSLLLQQLFADTSAARASSSNELPFHSLQQQVAGDQVLAAAQMSQRDRTPKRIGEAAVSLNQIAIEMINRVDLSSLLQHIADSTNSLASADYAYVALVHESGEYLETIAASNDSQNLQSIRHKRGEGIGGQAWITGETVCVPEYQDYPHRISGLTTAMQATAVPLKLGQRVIGVIGILYEHYERRIEDEVEVLEMFAPLASVAIDNARLQEKTRLELARTEAISRISRAIYGTASFDRIIDQICTTIIDTFDVSKTHLYRIADDGTYMPLAAWENVGGRVMPTRQAGSEMVARSVASWCIKNQQSAFIRRGVNDDRESADVHRIRAKWRLGSTICLPLVHEGKSWGVMFAHRFVNRSDFSESELKQFELIGVQISMALLRRELMVRVQHQAYHDSLTGLYNRWRFESLLVRSVEYARNSTRVFAVLSVDLIGFKQINDAHGHGVGDELLRRVASILLSSSRSDDELARMGGDEFSVIVSARSCREEVAYQAKQIRERLSQTLEINGVRVDVGVSIGICFYPEDARTADQALRHAEFAMHHAKNTAATDIVVFNRSILAAHENRRRLETDLRNALQDSQFELYYQPKVNCSTGLVDGVEALIRWNHPQRGFVAPSEFIPIAERCGLIERIGTWVLNQACLECSTFRRANSALKVAVNISARQFNVDDFVQQVFSTLERNSLPAECLELEVTESVVMHDITNVVNKLAQLRSSGVTIAIDDFGTGYSSLQYLAELPLDVLKIDKSFIDRIEDERDGQLLVKTILMMSRELKLKTVAEGVETRSQCSQLRELACDYIQGYYYSKPVAAAELLQVIEEIDRPNQSRIAA